MMCSWSPSFLGHLLKGLTISVAHVQKNITRTTTKIQISLPNYCSQDPNSCQNGTFPPHNDTKMTLLIQCPLSIFIPYHTYLYRHCILQHTVPLYRIPPSSKRTLTFIIHNISTPCQYRNEPPQHTSLNGIASQTSPHLSPIPTTINTAIATMHALPCSATAA